MFQTTLTVTVDDLAKLPDILVRALTPTARELLPVAEEGVKDVVAVAKETAEERGIPGRPLSGVTEILKGHNRYAWDSGRMWTEIRVVSAAKERRAEAAAIPTGRTMARYEPGAPRDTPPRNADNSIPYAWVLHILEEGHTWTGESALRMLAYLAVMLEKVGMVLPKHERKPGEKRQARIYLPPRPLYPAEVAEPAVKAVAERLVRVLVDRVAHVSHL